MKFEVGDKVKIVKFHHHDMEHRLGAVIGYATGMSQYIKVQVPGYLNRGLGDVWYFTEDEIEKIS